MLTKEEWRTVCIVAWIVFTTMAAWYSVSTAEEYKTLYDSYQDEKAIADMMEEVIAAKNHEIADLNKRIEELEARIPQ